MSTADAVLAWAVDALRAVGASEPDAAATVDALAYAERRGMGSHGLIRLPGYIDRVRAGGIDPAAQVEVVSELGGLLVLDAHHGIGAASATAAARMAAERSETAGVACALLSRANHFGAAGHYANLIADAGAFAIVASNTDRVMAPPGGGSRVLGTNPLAMAAPLPRRQRPQLDMASSSVSFGKVLLARQHGEPLEEGWAVDAAGRPTTDPADVAEGALLPAAGAKGFGLAYLIDALVALGGAPTSEAADHSSGFGMAFIAIRLPASTDPDAYAAQLDALAAAVHAAGAAGSSGPALAPGERGTRHERESQGRIDLGEALVDRLAALGAELGVPFPRETAAPREEQEA